MVGTVLVGSLFGWIIHKVFRAPYSVADVIGLVLLVIVTGFSNSGTRPLSTTWTIYGVAAVVAYFIIQRFRPTASTAPLATRAVEPIIAPATAADAPSSLSRAEIELEEEIVSSVRRQYASASTDAPSPPAKRRRQNFVARHWRGELSLPVSYWLINVAANVASLVAVTSLALTFRPSDGYEPVAILAVFVATWFALLIILVWQVVGLWRSAERRAGELHSIRASAFWPRAAQVMAVLGLLQFGASFNSTGLPQLNELSRIVFQNDPDIPDASLQIADDARTLILDGGIKYGLAREVKTLLDAAPSITGLLLRSPGGRIAEAVKVFDLVRARGLDTFVSDECSSACTLVFVAGRNRILANGGRLGFHGSYFPGATEEDLATANEDWARTYRSAGLSIDFVRQALSVPPESIWYPQDAELRAAGVTIGALSDVANAPPGFTPSATLESVRQDLLGSGSIYQALDAYVPASAAEVYRVALDYSLGSLTEAELRSEAGRIIADAVRLRIVAADDATLIDFASLAAAQYAELMVQDPSVCFSYAAYAQPTSIVDYLPDDLIARELALNERIIRGSGAPPQAGDPRDLEQGWDNLSLALNRTLTPDQFATFTKDVAEITPAEHGTYCLASVAFMEEIARLPLWQAGAIVRSLYE